MLLFFRLILVFVFILFLISLILVFSEVKIILNAFEYSTEKEEKSSKYSGKFEIYFLGKVKIFSKKIDNQKTGKFFNNNFIKERITRMNLFSKDDTTSKYKIDKKITKELRKNLKIELLKLQIQIDTESILLTSYLVGIISTLIPNLIKNNIKNYNDKDYQWSVIPIYKSKNFISLKLNSIISIKVVHIINMLKLIGGIGNERSSNRRLNVNCYGEH